LIAQSLFDGVPPLQPPRDEVVRVECLCRPSFRAGSVVVRSEDSVRVILPGSVQDLFPFPIVEDVFGIVKDPFAEGGASYGGRFVVGVHLHKCSGFVR
jgi:hypothetical protein